RAAPAPLFPGGAARPSPTHIFSTPTAGPTTTARPPTPSPPLPGSASTRTLMTPTPPIRLIELIDTGYAADLLFRIAVQQVNGVSNRRAAFRSQSMDPGFLRVLQALRRIQESGAVGFRIETAKETGKRDRLRPVFPEGA